MQKMQEHFSAAKTHESVLPRLVTPLRGELLAMTSFSNYHRGRALLPGLEFLILYPLQKFLVLG
jgi:hypothetical protein